MDGLEAAALFAEISVTITGFIAIFVALGSQDGGFPVEEHIKLKSLLAVSLACMAVSLSPVLVSQFTDDASAIWGLASVVGIAVLLLLKLWLKLFAGREHREKTGETAKSSAFELSLGVSALLLYIVNLTPLLTSPGPGLYLLALFLGLVICCKSFAQSLFRRFLN